MCNVSLTPAPASTDPSSPQENRLRGGLCTVVAGGAQNDDRYFGIGAEDRIPGARRSQGPTLLVDDAESCGVGDSAVGPGAAAAERTTLGTAPALDRYGDRLAPPVAHHAAAEIAPSIPPTPPGLVTQNVIFGHRTGARTASGRCINEANTRPCAIRLKGREIKTKTAGRLLEILQRMLRRYTTSGWLTGIEPATSGATVQRSNRLSYSHHGRHQLSGERLDAVLGAQRLVEQLRKLPRVRLQQHRIAGAGLRPEVLLAIRRQRAPARRCGREPALTGPEQPQSPLEPGGEGRRVAAQRGERSALHLPPPHQHRILCRDPRRVAPGLPVLSLALQVLAPPPRGKPDQCPGARAGPLDEPREAPPLLAREPIPRRERASEQGDGDVRPTPLP